METLETAVIYCRQSYTRDSDKLSISEQEKKAFEYAEMHNLTIVAPPFIDENTSSELYPLTDDAKMIATRDQTFLNWLAESQRHSAQYTKQQIPYKVQLGACFDCIKSKKVDYLIVWSFERLGRSEYSSCLQPFITDFLKSNNVKLIETKDGSITDYNNSNNQLLALIKSHIEYESLKTKKKSSINVIKNRIANSISASNAYGTLKRGKNIYFDQQKAQVIQYVFESLVEGVTYCDILHKLNSDFWHLRTTGAKKFYESSIYNIGSNPVYCGLMRYKENNLERLKEAKNIPKPIINVALFYEVQANMSKRKYNTVNLSGNPFGSRKHLPLSRILYCSCGNRMSVIYDSGNLVYDCRKMAGRKNYGCQDVRIRMKIDANRIHGYGLYDIVQKLFILIVAEKMQRTYYTKFFCEEENRLLIEIFNKKEDMRGALEVLRKTHRLDIFRKSFEEMELELQELEKQLIIIREKKYEKSLEMEKNIKNVFDQIVQDRQLSQEDFFIFTHQTLKKIVVYPDKVRFELFDENSFELPRIIGLRNVKYFPIPKIKFRKRNPNEKESYWRRKIHITFTVKSRGKEEVLLDTKNYRISIRR